jgi:hypothetical protein
VIEFSSQAIVPYSCFHLVPFLAVDRCVSTRSTRLPSVAPLLTPNRATATAAPAQDGVETIREVREKADAASNVTWSRVNACVPQHERYWGRIYRTSLIALAAKEVPHSKFRDCRNPYFPGSERYSRYVMENYRQT